MGVPVDPLNHAESCPPTADTQCHAQSHVVHMHNRYADAGWEGYPQYPQGLLTLLIPNFLLIQITSPVLPPIRRNVPKSLFWDTFRADRDNAWWPYPKVGEITAIVGSLHEDSG
jgi:hypothetical protein